MRQLIMGIAWLCLISPLSTGYSTAFQDSKSTAAQSAEEIVGSTLSEIWRNHIEAAKRKDLQAVTEIYADDIVYIIPGMQVVRGRVAIDQMEAQVLATSDVLHAEHTIESLSVFGDIAYEVGTVVGPIRQHGQETETVTFHFMALWRRQVDNIWRVQYFVGEPEGE